MKLSNKNKYLIILSLGIFILASGLVDLDWMVVGYKFQTGQATTEASTWEFAPWLTMGWWDAYAVTVAKIILGSGLIAFCYSKIKTVNKC